VLACEELCVCVTGAGVGFGGGFDTGLGFGPSKGAGSGSGVVKGIVVGGGGASGVVVVSVRAPRELAPATACTATRTPPHSKARTAVVATTTLPKPRRPFTADLPRPDDECSADPTGHHFGGSGHARRRPLVLRLGSIRRS
jgi:hypothetical protein